MFALSERIYVFIYDEMVVIQRIAQFFFYIIHYSFIFVFVSALM